MLDHSVLPPEIWLEILEWATYNPNILDETLPFQRIPDYSKDINLQVRHALSLVCRTWREWTVRGLYADIKIRHGTHALQQVLRGQDNPEGTLCYGNMVYRVVLPYQSTVTGPPGKSRESQSINILELCPRIHTLLRPQHSLLDGLSFDYEANSVFLPSLKRLEWWHHHEAERSGGINSLGGVIRHAPNLEYLFIGGVVGPNYIGMEHGRIELLSLKVFRLNIRSGMLTRQILSRWSLPTLTHLILDCPPIKDGLQEIWHAFGEQLEVVEFGKHVRFFLVDEISPCLQSCPNLKELNFYLFFAMPPLDFGTRTSLVTLGLHSHVNNLLSEGTAVWKLIQQHFEVICSSAFPSLHKIVLYGDWKPILQHPRFSPTLEMLKNSGKNLKTSI